MLRALATVSLSARVARKSSISIGSEAPPSSIVNLIPSSVFSTEIRLGSTPRNSAIASMRSSSMLSTTESSNDPGSIPVEAHERPSPLQTPHVSATAPPLGTPAQSMLRALATVSLSARVARKSSISIGSEAPPSSIVNLIPSSVFSTEIRLGSTPRNSAIASMRSSSMLSTTESSNDPGSIPVVKGQSVKLVMDMTEFAPSSFSSSTIPFLKSNIKVSEFVCGGALPISSPFRYTFTTPTSQQFPKTSVAIPSPSSVFDTIPTSPPLAQVCNDVDRQALRSARLE